MIDGPMSPRLLLRVACLGLLASCGQQPGPAQPVSMPQAGQSDLDEVHALIKAVKDNPSVKDPSLAGPPIHVDPYPKSAGMRHGASAPMNNTTR